MKKNYTSKTFLIIGIVITSLLICLVGTGVVIKLTYKTQNPVATIEVENYGTIKVELYPDQAPNTVANFITLANNEFYDNSSFHRVVPGFMIQGGSKNGDGTTGPTLGDLKSKSEKENQEKTDENDSNEYAIKGEMIANGYTNNKLKLEEGVIAMSRSDFTSISSSLAEEGYNSAGSQFFILHKDNTSINGSYAGFGKVIEGMQIVDKIANLDVTYRRSELGENDEVPKDETGTELKADMPLEQPVIKSIRVETYGVDYGKPETIEPFNYYNYLMQMYSSNYSE